MQTIALTKYNTRSAPTALLQFIIRPFASLLTGPGKPLPAGSPRLTPPSSTTKSCNVQERNIDDVWVYDITAKPSHTSLPNKPTTASPTRRRIFYIAGGSQHDPPSPDHWRFVTALAHKLSNTTISLLSPPLSPHSPAPTTFPHLTRLFRTLLTTAHEASETVIFVGDSSGANLVFTVMLEVLQSSPATPAPESIMMISPVVDLRFTNPDIAKIQAKDPVLRLQNSKKTAAMWASAWSLDDTRLSPVLADVAVLRERDVKVHGVTGGYDILTPDALRFRGRLEDEGVKGSKGEVAAVGEANALLSARFHVSTPRECAGSGMDC